MFFVGRTKLICPCMKGKTIMLITYIYRIGFNRIPGSINIDAPLEASTEYDIKKVICRQLQTNLNRCVDIYNIEILGMKQIA